MKVAFVAVTSCKVCPHGQGKYCAKVLEADYGIALWQSRPSAEGLRLDCPLADLREHSIELIKGQIDANKV